MAERGRFEDALAAAESVVADAGAGGDADAALRLEVLRAASASLSGDWDRCERLARPALARLGAPTRADPVAQFGWTRVAHAVALGERWQDDGEVVGQLRIALSRRPGQRLTFDSIRVLGLALAGHPPDADARCGWTGTRRREQSAPEVPSRDRAGRTSSWPLRPATTHEPLPPSTSSPVSRRTRTPRSRSWPAWSRCSFPAGGGPALRRSGRVHGRRDPRRADRATTRDRSGPHRIHGAGLVAAQLVVTGGSDVVACRRRPGRGRRHAPSE